MPLGSPHTWFISLKKLYKLRDTENNSLWCDLLSLFCRDQNQVDAPVLRCSCGCQLSATTPLSIWLQLQIWKRFYYYYYYYCRLCNSDLHIQENTHAISFKTSLLRSLSSSLLFVKYNYCRKFPDFQAHPYIRLALASLPTLCLTSPSFLPQLLLRFHLQFTSSSPLIQPIWHLLPGAGLHLVL